MPAVSQQDWSNHGTQMQVFLPVFGKRHCASAFAPVNGGDTVSPRSTT